MSEQKLESMRSEIIDIHVEEKRKYFTGLEYFCYSGHYTKQWKTPGMNQMFSMEKLAQFMVSNGVEVSYPLPNKDMNFLIPKRRLDLITRIRHIKEGQKIKLTIREEPRSKALVVDRMTLLEAD